MDKLNACFLMSVELFGIREAPGSCAPTADTTRSSSSFQGISFFHRDSVSQVIAPSSESIVEYGPAVKDLRNEDSRFGGVHKLLRVGSSYQKTEVKGDFDYDYNV